VSVAIQNFAA